MTKHPDLLARLRAAAVRLFCFVGLHKIGEVLQWGGGVPNAKCARCGALIAFDPDGNAYVVED